MSSQTPVRLKRGIISSYSGNVIAENYPLKTIHVFVLLSVAAAIPFVGCGKNFPIGPVLTPIPMPTPFCKTATPNPTSTPTPLPDTPTPTPIPTPIILNCLTPVPTSGACLSGASLISLTGTLTTVSYTSNPAMNSQSVTGSVPVGGLGYGGEYVLQNGADWAALVASSVSPTTSYPIPFNPSTQTMLVISRANFDCCNERTILIG